eukprot:TRINITY_DN236_c0_g1_i3.p1 TRINITY_DN236_c0_g1~~TRINITY_DN236_c0_g1_i3.p1  ORF type:complete len:230 (-),score=37.81 TRINITY_DN236_c0_g1_i3:827-1516(-)
MACSLLQGSCIGSARAALVAKSAEVSHSDSSCLLGCKKIANSRCLLFGEFQPVKNTSVSSRRTSSENVAAVVKALTSSVDSETSAPSSEVATYHFLVANANFMLDEEEHFQEQMRERLRWFKEQGRQQDFWLAFEPKFLDNFPEITERLRRPAVALVSTDATWITFMKLRLDRVLRGQVEASSVEEALDSQPFNISFPKPAEWTAPYPKYEGPWWTPLLPPQFKEASSN